MHSLNQYAMVAGSLTVIALVFWRAVLKVAVVLLVVLLVLGTYQAVALSERASAHSSASATDVR